MLSKSYANDKNSGTKLSFINNSAQVTKPTP